LGPRATIGAVPIDRYVAALMSLIANAGYPAIADGTVEQARRGIRALLVDLRNPATLPQVDSIADGVAGGVPVRIYRPAASGALPTVVFLHGGGFVIGDLDTADPVCRLLCRDAEAVVVSVDYRRAPEARFPAAVEDSWAALQSVAAHVEDYGGDGTKLGWPVTVPVGIWRRSARSRRPLPALRSPRNCSSTRRSTCSVTTRRAPTPRTAG
jgi:acetyl esterase